MAIKKKSIIPEPTEVNVAEEQVVEQIPQNELVVDLTATKRKHIKVFGDINGYIDLNLSDLNIATRASEDYPKLLELAREAEEKLANIPDDPEGIGEMAEVLKQIDADMRGLLDHLFDAKVSDVCAPNGTMYDPFNGEFRFEHIINSLAKLYSNNFDNEFNAMKKKVSKHTNKYAKKYHN